MSETVGHAVAIVNASANLIYGQVAEFAKLLPASVDPEQYAAWALQALKAGLASRDDKQLTAWQRVLDPANEAGRISLVLALKDCATLGLHPGSTYHLVPFGSTVTGVTDWTGEVQLISNARKCSVVAQLVREGDTFAMRAANAPPAHLPPDPDDASSWFDTGRPVIGGYSYVAYGNEEYSMVTRMSEAEFLKRRDKARTRFIWDEWPDQMRLKSLVKPLRKVVPWSAERLWK